MSQRRTLRHPAEPGHSTAKRISDGITSVKTIVMKQTTGRASNGDQSLLNVRDAASFLGLSKSFLDKARIRGDGPHYRSEERRVGKECVGQCRSRGSQYHKKKKASKKKQTD